MPYRLQCPSRAGMSLIKRSHLKVPYTASYIDQHLQSWETSGIEQTLSATAKCGTAVGEHLWYVVQHGWKQASFALEGPRYFPQEKTAKGLSFSLLCWPLSLVHTIMLSNELTHNVMTTSPFFGCQTLNERKLGCLEGCHFILCQRPGEFSYFFFFF